MLLHKEKHQLMSATEEKHYRRLEVSQSTILTKEGHPEIGTLSGKHVFNPVRH